ncbi:HlyD family secretion protein [bacterium]|nr:HlyD family secretion protein [bacterium]
MTEEKEQSKKKKLVIIVCLAVVMVLCGCYALYDITKYQSTDDAYVETTMVSVAPKVSGEIMNVYITDNQHVNEGDLIAEIDDTDYKIKLDQINAKYEKIMLNQKNAKAVYTASETDIAVAKADLERYKKLYEKGAVSKQALDAAQAKYEAANARFTNAEQGLLSNPTSKKMAVADSDLKEVLAQKYWAEQQLKYTKIYAPQSGYVANRRVERGMFAQVGSPLFTLVPDNIWVVANYKESQLTNMKVGQKVKIKIDAYPKAKFNGVIDSIQRSSGAKSSLFPPENAVGSFVKIVQRIPVKIIFTDDIDKDKYTIVPGMSVVPKVQVR